MLTGQDSRISGTLLKMIKNAYWSGLQNKWCKLRLSWANGARNVH